MNNNHPQTFDDIYDHRVGHGRYQRIAYFFLGLVAFSDEAEIITLSIILPAISKEWNLSETQQQLLGSVLFLGIFFGSLIIGPIADKMGRRFALIVSVSLQLIFGLGAVSIRSFNLFLALRALLGMTIGCTIPVAVTYITEISISSYRGKSQVFVQAFFVFGMIYAMIISKLFMTNLESGHWRNMLFAGAVPNLVVLMGILFFIEESPRFLAATERFQDSFNVMNKIASVNLGLPHRVISHEDKEAIRAWQETYFQTRDKTSFLMLFKGRNRRITLCLLFSWFGLSFNFYGMIFILPFVLGGSTSLVGEVSDINKFFIVLFGEVPALGVAYYLLDNHMFGRKKSTIFGHVLSAVAFFIAYFCSGTPVLIFLILARLATKLSFITINPLTTELYQTHHRALALGFTSGVGRLGAVLMPVVIYALFDVNKSLPFIAFGGISVIMAIILAFIPYEPLGTQLDEIIESEERMGDDVKDEEKYLLTS